MSIKEQITTDLAVAGSKIGAAVSVTAATYSPGYTLSDWAPALPPSDAGEGHGR